MKSDYFFLENDKIEMSLYHNYPTIDDPDEYFNLRIGNSRHETAFFLSEEQMNEVILQINQFKKEQMK